MAQLIQYVVVREDLIKTLGWSIGSVIAQACHACTAVTHLYHDDIHTKNYLADIDSMRKVVLKVSDENCLTDLKTVLDQNAIKHKLWIEQPENTPTCLVVKPYPKEEIHSYVKKLKLF